MGSAASCPGAWLAAVFLFATELCSAAPFLVCDPYSKEGEQPTGFFVASGKLTFSTPAERLPNGAVRLKFDLGNLPDGEHKVEVRAVNESTGAKSEPVHVQILKKDGQAVILATPQPIPEKQKIPPSRTIPGLRKP